MQFLTPPLILALASDVVDGLSFMKMSATTTATTSASIKTFAAPIAHVTAAPAIVELATKTSTITRTWEPMAAQEIVNRFNSVTDGQEEQRPFMVALVGIPGSGKSTSCDLVVEELSTKYGFENVLVMPHDGYHYTKEELKAMDDPDDLIYRRGAPETFDAKALLHDLKRIRDGQEDTVCVPGFDHAKGDPEPDEHTFERSQHPIVVCEGLYLLHEGDGWDEIPDQFDFRIFIDSDLDLCIDRVKIRNKCIPGYTEEEIEVRADLVDRVNALTVHESVSRADLVVDSALATPKIR